MAKKENKICTSIGGQAVMEGVMMMGSTCMATAVRDPDNEIQIETVRFHSKSNSFLKLPIVRGCVGLFRSMVRGTKALLRSASVVAEDGEEEGGRFSRWLAEKFEMSIMDVVGILSTVLGFALAMFLFMFLPNVLVQWIRGFWQDMGVWEYVFLGFFKLVIFLAYLGLILLLKDMRRLYAYHGAEHKTINCFESGKLLTVENVRASSRIHDRCGTSFLFIVLTINIVILSLVYWAVGVHNIENGFLKVLARLGIELVLLPLLAGVGYEVLRLLAKVKGKWAIIFKWPGVVMQKVFTTREPDDEMIEVAIAAFQKVLEMDADEEMEEVKFITGGLLSQMLKETKALFNEHGIDESDAEWIYALALDVKRSELNGTRNLKPCENKKIQEIVAQRLTGRPLWYIIGDTEFYDCKIKCDERALIPRPETEILADIVVKNVEDGNKVLDMCTGSGCIAVSVAKHCKGRGVQVTGVDVSDAAIMLAKENANLNSVDVTFVKSDLFRNVHGRFHIIVCNPPYIPTKEVSTLQKEVREHEPRIALDGGDDGLDFYRRVAEDAKRYLTKDGMIFFECGEGQAEEIIKLFPKREYVMIMKDFSGVDRFVKIAF